MISVLADRGFSVCRQDKARMENMTTERTTEGESPVRNANPHKSKIMTKSRMGFRKRKCFHNGLNKNQNKAYKKPICIRTSTWIPSNWTTC